jgi:Cft2 family RNA processing exonuclease
MNGAVAFAGLYQSGGSLASNKKNPNWVASNDEIDAALQMLEKTSEKFGVDITVVGSMAVAKNGYAREMADIDIVVNDRDKFISAMQEYGYANINYNYIVVENGLIIDIVPMEVEIPKGFNYQSLNDIVLHKLKSSKPKDRSDIIRMIKEATPQQLVQMSGFPEPEMKIFEYLLEEAQLDSIRINGKKIWRIDS